MPQGGSRSFTFVFVCQGGALELKAMLLAASLRDRLRCQFELVAAIPSPPRQWAAPSSQTLDFLKSLDVRTVSIANQIDPSYPIGNKVSCMGIEATTDRLVFVDTDMLQLGEFDDHARFDVAFAAKPADLPGIARMRDWRRAYLASGVRQPPARVATSVFGELTPLYFNAGWIAVDPSVGFGPAWLDCCQRADARWGISCKRPHLDQLALPVAVTKLGLRYVCLDESYNFPAHVKPIDESSPPLFAHYHTALTLRREPLLRQRVEQLCDAHPALAQRLRADAEFAPLLERPRPRPIRRAEAGAPPARCGEMIITGIPRSGTSYLCNLLHRYANCVMVNEPDQISRSLRKQPIPFGVGTFFRDMRREILEGRPIQNKLRDGKVTDETLDANDLTEYSPKIADDDFVLGVKNPLGFVSRMDALRQAMPSARIIACVRNPFDTIASWKTSFAHLRDADVRRMQAGGLLDRFLSARQRAALTDVARIKPVAWRRAAWWRYLAELIGAAGPSVIVVRYADLTDRPTEILEPIVAGLNVGELVEPIEPSTARQAKRSALDEEDVQAIRALCGPVARALGVCDVWGDASASGSDSAQPHARLNRAAG